MCNSNSCFGGNNWIIILIILLLFCGNGCEKAAGILGGGNAFFAPCNPLAEFMAPLAYKKFLAGEFEDVAYMEPFYLKEFEIGKSKKKILG